MTTNERLILALDGFEKKEDLLVFAANVGYRVYALKVHEALDRFGVGLIRELRDLGVRRVWVDLKFHDIPEIVLLRAKVYADAGADILSVHALGGMEMMLAARESGLETYAITLLTSLKEHEMCPPLSFSIQNTVCYLARLAKCAGMDGIVCSVQEADTIAKMPKMEGVKIVTPGIRFEGEETHDQERTASPIAALRAGAHHVVVGRSVTKAPDPIAAFEWLDREVRDFLHGRKNET